MKSGFVAVLGRPNAGKSTFVNAFLSKRVSITSPKAQTTRENILGIYHEKDLEIVFTDTPGLFDGKEGLYKKMKRDALSSLQGADCALYLVDATRGELEAEAKTIESLKLGVPLIIGYNKIDLVTVPEGIMAKEFFASRFPKASYRELSALKNYGFREIKEEIERFLPEGPSFYEENRYTDRSKEFMAREVVREKMLRFLKEEIPHTSAVKIDSFEKKGDSYAIKGTIYLDRESHLPIVVGRKGEMIKRISMAARRELESEYRGHVSLYLNCKVSEGWRSSPKMLSMLGYGRDQED